MRRNVIFVIALVYLLAILALGLLFFVRRSWLVFVPDALGPVPVGVPWFGALGAVVISLTGVFEHEHDWDEGFWPWHIARPLIGVALGVVSVLILQAGILAVGSTPHPQPTTMPANLLYYLVAFLVGYREETFRELIKRLVDLILTPGGGNGNAPAIQDVAPATAPHAAQTPVVLTGSGFTGTKSVKFGDSAAKFTVNSDGQLTATSPVVASGGDVTLTVTNKGGSATHKFTFS